MTDHIICKVIKPCPLHKIGVVYNFIKLFIKNFPNIIIQYNEYMYTFCNTSTSTLNSLSTFLH